jgi:hypothetical protein
LAEVLQHPEQQRSGLGNVQGCPLDAQQRTPIPATFWQLPVQHCEPLVQVVSPAAKQHVPDGQVEPAQHSEVLLQDRPASLQHVPFEQDWLDRQQVVAA